MKKGILLAVGLLFVLAGCGTNQAKDASSKSTDTIVTKTSKTGSTTTKESDKTESSSSSETKVKTESTATSTSESTQTTTAESATPSSQPVEKNSWDASKATELATFMSTWGQEMGQQYRSYNDHVNANYYGLQVPQYIFDGQWSMVIDQTPVTVEWSENGRGQAGFELVAIYSDIDHPKPSGAHLYFFGFQQNQPKVMVTQQNQGNPNNYLYFKETENNELKNGFERIVNS